MDRAPQVDRLLARLRALASPLIQVWGWPGSGRSELLAALLEREGERARALAPERVAAGAVRSAVAEGVRWLVVSSLPRHAEPEEIVAELAEALPADRRLVFATRRRVAAPELLCGLLAPADLALTPDEVATLARETGAAVPTRALARRLVVASDGWYRPLRLVFEASAGAGAGSDLADGPPADPAELAAIPEVARFLRRNVLADLSPADRSALRGLDGSDGPGGADPAIVRRLDRELGLLVAGEGGARAPNLLAAALAAEGAGLGDRPGLADRSDSGAATAATPGLAGPPALDPRVEVPGEAAFRLHLLGRPEAWRRGVDGSWQRLHWPLKRAFRALAYLASAPERRAAREELVEALWGDAEAEVVKRNFHPTLSHLRRGLRGEGSRGDEPEPIPLADGVYALEPELGWWTDLDELARLEEVGAAFAAHGRDEEAIATWEAAWRLYRGQFLEGSYEPWVLRRREEHQRRYLRLIQRLAASRLRLGRLTEAIDAYRAVLVEDPLQESAHVELMRLYARSGRRDLLRRQYERLTLLLREELGVEPLPETTREFHRLMTDHG